MQSEVIQISNTEEFINWNGFDIKEFNLSLRSHDNYISGSGSYRCHIALLDKDIVVVNSSGTPKPSDLNKVTGLLNQIISTQSIEGATVVWDFSNITFPGIKVRSAILQIVKKYMEAWNSIFLIFPPKISIVTRIYSSFLKQKVKNLSVADSVKDALTSIVAKSPSEEEISKIEKLQIPSRASMRNKSKDELIDIIENMHVAHQNSNQKVLEMLGQISWEGRFNKVEIDDDENSPGFELMQVMSLLQHDVAEIIDEFKELNQNLELKVAERMVDFIDKESNLRSILDSSDRSIWLINTRLELMDFNVAFSNDIQKKYNKVPKIHQNVLDLFDDPKQKGIWKNRFETALNGKPSIYLDQDYNDIEEHVWQIRTSPITEIGKIKGVSVDVEDITDLKQSHLKLIEKNRDLEKVNSELDSFVYRVSHDLRAPLTSILGLISLMKMETSPEKVHEYIEMQEKSIVKLDQFINEIINLSRNSRLGVSVSRININELIHELFEGQHYIKTANEIKRICNVCEDVVLFSDLQRLSIILNNLISNSLKYANPYQECPFVEVNVYMEYTNCIIEVLDNGIGIPENLLPRIFEMFFRATQKHSGSGLGLYIVKETVEKLKGTISVEPQTPYGTMFRVVLPSLKDKYITVPEV